MNDLGTCRAQLSVGPFFILCGQPAVAVHVYGCVHEHVKERATCAEHRPKPGDVGCWYCLQAGHECEMTYQEVTVSEGKDCTECDL